MNKTRKHISLLFWLIVFALVSVIGSAVAYINAYFTASSSRGGDLTFHNIELQLNSSNPEGSIFAEEIKVIPGDTVEFSNLSVENVGTDEVFSLVNLNIYIVRSGYADYNIDIWKNLDGDDVNFYNFSQNTTGATKLAIDETKNLTLSHTFAGEIFDNSFQNVTAAVTIKAVGIQTKNLEAIDSITQDNLIASRMLVDEFGSGIASNIVDMNQFETQDVVDCSIPTQTFFDGTYNYQLHNMDIINAQEGDTIYVQAKDADMVFIIPGNHELQTLLYLYQEGGVEALPAGTIEASGQTVTSFTVGETQTADVQAMSTNSTFTCEFSVVTASSGNKIPVVRLMKTQI